MKVPAVKETVSTREEMLQVPAASLGDANDRTEFLERPNPVPVSEMMIVPFDGMATNSGVIRTVMLTSVEPAPTLLRDMLG